MKKIKYLLPILNPFQRKGLAVLIFTIIVSLPFGKGWGWVGAAQNMADNDAKLIILSDKCAEYHLKTDGESDGYRIKIHFGIDKNAAHEVKQKFSSKYNDISSYEEYHQPNFVVVVGDFKTRIDAYEIFKKIQADFPNAFIIKSKIKPAP